MITRRSGAHAFRPNCMYVTRAVWQQIQTTIGCLTAETGGMLGGRKSDGVITHFYFDGSASRNRSTYSPDIERVNKVLSTDWNPAGIDLLGFVHSHPAVALEPSAGDLAYADTILRANPGLPRVLLPIVSSRPDSGQFSVKAYEVARTAEGRLGLKRLKIQYIDDAPPLDKPSTFEGLPMFERVRTTYDLRHLEQARIIAVGCGGSASFVEDLARAGVGEFILIDPDVVAMSNLATQQTYRRDIGRPKVEAVADRIRDINPRCRVLPLAKSLNEFADVTLCYVAAAAFRRRPSAVLLCGMTDNFSAQARVNRLALNFGWPSLCAQVYEGGRGAEVTFTHPASTRACHRCILRSRYEAYRRGFQNHVGSIGSPFMSTARLNALKQFIALSLLHHGTGHPRWGSLVDRIGQRNLIQLRLDPDYQLPGFTRALAGADPLRVFCDEAVWLPQAAWRACPDCRGVKRVSRLMGMFADTRKDPSAVVDTPIAAVV